MPDLVLVNVRTHMGILRAESSEYQVVFSQLPLGLFPLLDSPSLTLSVAAAILALGLNWWETTLAQFIGECQVSLTQF